MKTKATSGHLRRLKGVYATRGFNSQVFTFNSFAVADKHPEQPASTGSGPLLERRYFIDVARPRQSPAQLMAEVQADVPRFSPETLADFKKKADDGGPIKLDDEFHITILGPWNGSVRVREVGATSFELITLEGHPEAGRIRFEAHYLDESPDVLRFEIRSSARSRDGLVAFAYDTLGGGKLMQEATWVEFCRRVAQASGGQALGNVIVETFRHDEAGHVQHTRHE